MTNRNIVFTVTTVWLILNIIFWITMMFLYPNSLTGSNRANAYDEIKIILEKCLIPNNVTFFPFHYFITFVTFSIIFISLQIFSYFSQIKAKIAIVLFSISLLALILLTLVATMSLIRIENFGGTMWCSYREIAVSALILIFLFCPALYWNLYYCKKYARK